MCWISFRCYLPMGVAKRAEILAFSVDRAMDLRWHLIEAVLPSVFAKTKITR